MQGCAGCPMSLDDRIVGFNAGWQLCTLGRSVETSSSGGRRFVSARLFVSVCIEVLVSFNFPTWNIGLGWSGIGVRKRAIPASTRPRPWKTPSGVAISSGVKSANE